jgi:isocitrate dehydrogenase
MNKKWQFCEMKVKIPTRITIARGDGIGPEIMDATLQIISAAGCAVETDEIIVGEKSYLNGNQTGIPTEAWDILRKNKLFLKGPITTPQGGGYKSVNVTLRKVLGLYANIRPCQSYHPYIATKHPVMDVVIIRENEEDLYAGIEHQQTDEVIQCLKLISKPGTEKIIRYAFEYARSSGRKKVSCFTKDNIMKLTDGLFHKTFDRIGNEYSEIEKEHLIVDIGAARLADTPELFDVIVMPNLYGDILSDVATQITGSVGLGGSVNIGHQFALFEAIHGSAPLIAGKDIANPSGLLLAAVQLLMHIEEYEAAARIQNAWLKTMEDGIHTADIFREGLSKKKVGTRAFAEEVISRLGQVPNNLQTVEFQQGLAHITTTYEPTEPATKKLVGVDVFIHCTNRNPEELAARLLKCQSQSIPLKMITNRGTKVWPGGFPETFCTDHWRCRFTSSNDELLAYSDVLHLMEAVHQQGLEIIKTENLYTFDGVPGFTAAQGQ